MMNPIVWGPGRAGLLSGVLILGISVLHVVTSATAQTQHAVYARLYYLPITIAALAHGLRGGFTGASAVGVTYGASCVFLQDRFESLGWVAPALDMVVMTGVGVLVGWTVDRERRQRARAADAERLAGLGEAAAVMAHEMKTPLITIGGFARSMLRRTPDDEDRKRLGIVVWEVSRLERLVRDGLDFTKTHGLNPEPHRLADLVARAADVVLPLARARNVEVHLAVAEPDDVVLCDCDRLQQVLVNLVDNALAHTPAGGAVRLEVQRFERDGVRFTVRDEGPGIPDDLRENLFEPFAGARIDGSGLGLAIAQRIVKAHGSRIEAENLPGGGARFRFDLAVHSGRPDGGADP